VYHNQPLDLSPPAKEKKVSFQKEGDVGCCGRAQPAHNTPRPGLLKRYKKGPFFVMMM
jgi:hypothetical protein